MSEHIQQPEPFIVTEAIEDYGRRIRFINANSPMAEALEPDDFWRLIVGKSSTVAWETSVAESLQEFFGAEDAPDELVVVSPLHDTSAITPIRFMFASCMDSPHVIWSGQNIYLPVWGGDNFDGFIRVEQTDCSTIIPHHDDPTNSSSTVFRASLAKLPKGFLFNYKEPLSLMESEAMLADLATEQ